MVNITINITSQLKAKLQGTALTENILCNRFSEWINGGEDSSYWFGRVKKENHLCHAYMVPVNEKESLDRWNYLWCRRRAHQRRSDGYLLYAHDPRHGYLLIDVLFDPGAHNLWTRPYRQQLDDYEAVADNFVFNGSFP